MSMKHHYIHHQLAGKTAVFHSAGKQESITGWKKNTFGRSPRMVCMLWGHNCRTLTKLKQYNISTEKDT